ncbi:MAG: hypothetical protein Q7T11_05075, partial [Deltaproteobacteria bacterium]|nr:hypothetical protein [Deltaproteobacteria bacterium]
MATGPIKDPPIVAAPPSSLPGEPGGTTPAAQAPAEAVDQFDRDSAPQAATIGPVQPHAPLWTGPPPPPPEGERVLLELLARREEPYTNRFADLGDRYEWGLISEDEEDWKRKQEGIHTWGDLKSFMELALGTDARFPLELEIDQYNFPTLQPTPEFLSEVQSLFSTHKKRIDLIIHGDPMDPPTVYWFDETGIHCSLVEKDEKASQAIATSLIEFGLDSDQRKLWSALQEAHRKHPQASLGDFLDAALSECPGLIPSDRRSEIFSRLEELKTAFLVAAKSKYSKVFKEPGVKAWNPIDRMLREHPANRSSQNCWYSIGAGQMVSVMEFTRTLIDRGALPLDFRLLADDRVTDNSFATVWEPNVLKTKKAFLADQKVNPDRRKQIYVLNERQRHEALLTYQPEVIFLNLKGGILPKVLDEALLKILGAMPNKPVLATPAKSYTDDGGIVYLEAYAKLAAQDPELARLFTILGGFFAAPQILKNEKVYLTLAAESEEGPRRVLRGLSPAPFDPKTNRANWDHAEVKIIASKELAAALNAGGANKNFLTYRSARILTRDILAFEGPIEGTALGRFEEQLQGEKERNVEIGEEITARIAAHFGIETDAFDSPDGLVKDFWKCLPDDVKGVIEIKRRLEEVIAGRDLSGLARLIEEIRLGLGGGTRNARDGYIDEIILHSFIRFRENGTLLIGSDFEKFYTRYYPKKWTGKRKAQEGRNGIGPLVQFAKRNRITLPAEVYEAFSFYQPKSAEIFPGERERDFTDSIIEPWGLGAVRVRLLEVALRLIDRRLDRTLAETTQREMIEGLTLLRDSAAGIEGEGKYPEVTRKILIIRRQVETLISILDGDELSPERKNEAVTEFASAVRYFRGLFRETGGVDTPRLLSGIRYAAKKLHRVKLAILREQRRQMYDDPQTPAPPMARYLQGGTSVTSSGHALIAQSG